MMGVTAEGVCTGGQRVQGVRRMPMSGGVHCGVLEPERSDRGHPCGGSGRVARHKGSELSEVGVHREGWSGTE